MTTLYCLFFFIWLSKIISILERESDVTELGIKLLLEREEIPHQFGSLGAILERRWRDPFESNFGILIYL